MSSWVEKPPVQLTEGLKDLTDETQEPDIPSSDAWLKGLSGTVQLSEDAGADDGPSISGVGEDGGLRPVVFCGPSGVGKGTLIDLLMKRFPAVDPETNLPAPVGEDGKRAEDDGEGKTKKQFGFSVSHTTRNPRDGEVDGTHYNFTNVPQMKQEIEDGKFVEYAEVHGNYYGTSLEAVESVKGKGMICVLDIDVQGVQNVKKSDLDSIYIFIAPPSMEELEKRLRGRGTEKEESITKRLANAKAEMKYGYEAGNFHKILVNSDLETTFEELTTSFKKWYPSLIEVSPDDEQKSCSENCVIS